MKKLLALLLAVVMLLSFAACGGGDDDDEEEEMTYKTAVQIYEKLMNGKSSDLKKSLPDAYWTNLKNEADMSYNDAKEYFDTQMEYMLDYYGDSYKANVKILSAEKMDSDDLEELVEQMMDQYEYITASSVSQAYLLELEMSMSYDGGSEADEEEVAAVKMGDGWYLVSEYGRFAMDMFGEWG